MIFKHLLGYSKLDLTSPKQWNGFEYHSIQNAFGIEVLNNYFILKNAFRHIVYYFPKCFGLQLYVSF